MINVVLIFSVCKAREECALLVYLSLFIIYHLFVIINPLQSEFSCITLAKSLLMSPVMSILLNSLSDL